MSIHQQLMQAILCAIEKHRNGESVDTLLLKSVSSSFSMLGLDENDTTKKTLDIYKKYFEERFIETTRQFYSAESEKFIAENSVTDYMRKSELRLKEEESRVEMYLDSSSMRPSVLIEGHKNLLVDEFKQLLIHEKSDELHRCYYLLNRVENGLQPLKETFESHVRQYGLESIEKLAQSNEEDPKNYVDTLLVVHKKFYDTVVISFKNDAGFMAALDKACRDFVNRNAACGTSSTKSPELLARYADSLLKKSAKNTEETDLEDKLNSLMTVFKYIEDRDVFQKFYSQNLSKRLVNELSATEDGEASMISKLKEVCGVDYTSKLSKMFTDMSVSKDLNEKYKDRLAQNHDASEFGKMDFYCKVLTSNAWQLQSPSTHFTLPQEMEKHYTRFSQFYASQHSGRKLTWLLHYSFGELKTNYLKASKVGYTFTLYTYAIGVLLQYNDETQYTGSELAQRTGLNEDTLKGILVILTKARVILVDGQVFNATNEEAGIDLAKNFNLNFGFKSKKIRVNLKMTVKNEQKAESEETHKTIEEDRKLVMQAAIVRIMKTRKLLKHVNLVQEVIAQVQNRFKPRIPDIKKCIDILLEKEYIERVEGQKDTYSYIA